MHCHVVLSPSYLLQAHLVVLYLLRRDSLLLTQLICYCLVVRLSDLWRVPFCLVYLVLALSLPVLTFHQLLLELLCLPQHPVLYLPLRLLLWHHCLLLPIVPQLQHLVFLSRRLSLRLQLLLIPLSSLWLDSCKLRQR